MLGVLCATRPKPWLLSLVHVHASLPRLPHSPLSPSASPPPRRRHSTACKLFLSAGGAASIWHAIMPRVNDDDGFRRGVVAFHDMKGEGSWNVAWDARPARWLHRPDSAWLLFGVCACLAPPSSCVDADTNTDAIAVDESCRLLDKEREEYEVSADYRVTGLLSSLYFILNIYIGCLIG